MARDEKKEKQCCQECFSKPLNDDDRVSGWEAFLCVTSYQVVYLRHESS